MAAPNRSSEAYRIIQEEWYPSGSSLDTDRKKLAETVFRPDEIDKWIEKGINRSDLQGFDTTDAREPTQREIMSNLHSQMKVGYVESDPDRFVRDGQETYRLLQAHKGEITGYEAFVEAVKKAWSRDKSLPDLLANMSDGDFRALYKTRQVQEWLTGNTSEVIVQGLMQRYNIERRRAEAAFAKLNDDTKTKILSSLMTGRRIELRQRTIVEQEPEPIPMPVAPAQTIRQKSRAGRFYQRSKPIIWTDLQTLFLRNNRQIPLRPLTSLYNATFSLPRTLASIRNKRQRLRY